MQKGDIILYHENKSNSAKDLEANMVTIEELITITGWKQVKDLRVDLVAVLDLQKGKDSNPATD